MEQTINKCDICANWVIARYDKTSSHQHCIYGVRPSREVIECSHFKAKPKEKKFGEGKIEKAVDKKGQNIEYGLCSCGEQLLTKEELKKGKCDICLEKIRSLGI